MLVEPFVMSRHAEGAPRSIKEPTPTQVAKHSHCLISLNKDQSISKVAQLIKGESSNWINRNKITKTKFYWQDDYWAASVSKVHIKEVRQYICEQAEHHKKITFAEEVENFMKKYGWKYLK